VLSFAGLWDQWKNPETGEPVTSFTIIVTEANALTGRIHNRMPVMIENAHVRPWLDGAEGTELLKSAREDLLQVWPVSKRVNRPRNDEDVSLIEPCAVASF
jgi:putative SOS response-associated peptidase YedK